MAVDLSPYRIAANERPASAVKQNNTLRVVQDALNQLPPSQVQGYPADATKYLSGTGTWSAPVVTAISPTVRMCTGIDVVNTAAKTDLLNGQITVPANAVSYGGAVKLWAAGDYANNTGGWQAFTLELKLGTSVIWSAGSDNIVWGATRYPWFCEAVIQAIGNWDSLGGGFFILGTAFTPSLVAHFGATWSGLPWTAAQPLAFSVTHTAVNANLSMRCDYARVEAM
jgi:hypothetical protein